MKLIEVLRQMQGNYYRSGYACKICTEEMARKGLKNHTQRPGMFIRVHGQYEFTGYVLCERHGPTESVDVNKKAEPVFCKDCEHSMVLEPIAGKGWCLKHKKAVNLYRPRRNAGTPGCHYVMRQDLIAKFAASAATEPGR